MCLQDGNQSLKSDLECSHDDDGDVIGSLVVLKPAFYFRPLGVTCHGDKE